jgi:hypothetical protein
LGGLLGWRGLMRWDASGRGAGAGAAKGTAIVGACWAGRRVRGRSQPKRARRMADPAIVVDSLLLERGRSGQGEAHAQPKRTRIK